MKRNVYLLIILFFLTGCTVTYDLDISPVGFEENLTINASSLDENDKLELFPISAYFDVQGNQEDPTKKEENVDYYESSEKVDKNGLKSINYNYFFEGNNFLKSGIVNDSFENFILRKYDYDEDGVNDYMILTASDGFSYFENNDSLEKITININCHYKVISNNADEVNGNVYTWYFTPDDISSISIVYDPLQAIVEKSWIDLLFNSTLLLIVGILFIVGIIYFVMKKRVKNVNDV